jgi:hypothetical protein
MPGAPGDVRWYPLQKRGLFSNIKGDLGWVFSYFSSPASFLPFRFWSSSAKFAEPALISTNLRSIESRPAS